MMKNILFVVIVVLFSKPLLAQSIVVLGDSISAGYGMEVDQGWVNLLQEKLDAEKKTFTMINESISGDTSAGGLARINKALSTYQPAVLLLELGANDGLRGFPPKHIRENLGQIIQRAQHSGAKVLLLSMRIPPNYGKRYTEMFYQVYPQLAKEFKIPFIPFLMEEVALNEKYMQRDGLHPNVDAQPLIADIVWKYLTPML